MKGFVVYPTYRIEDNKALVYLFGRLENGESFLTINEFRPYFFIEEKDVAKLKKIKVEINCAVEETSFKNFKEEPVSKVILNLPKDVPRLRKIFEDEKIECYEADIRFVYRFLIDKDIKGSLNIEGDYKKGKYVNRIYENPTLKPAEFEPKLKTLSIDIETDSEAKEIYSIALYAEDFKKVLIVSDKNLKQAESFKDEKSLLGRFKELIIQLDPDIITGWNVIDFDIAKIKERFDANKIDFILGRTEWKSSVRIQADFFRDSSADIAGRMVLDAIHLLRSSFIRLDDYRLATAADSFLNEKKLIDEENKGEEIERLFKKEPQKLVDYNLKDAELVLRILEKHKIIELTVERSLLTGMQLDRVKASIASLDSLYLRETRRKRYACPSSTFEEREERIKGGFVRDSIPGIYDFIDVLDFKSLYPSIIRTFNIDPIAMDPKGEIKAPNEARFKTKDAILPLIIQNLWEGRDKAKKRKDVIASYAIKIHMNSIFGVMANPTCRFYSTDLANAITHFGQFIVKTTANEIEKLGYRVIYGDSVGKDTEIIIKTENNDVEFKKISELFVKKRKVLDGKEYDFKKNIKVLTLDEEGKSVFKDIKYVMRHKTNKKIYRVYFTKQCFIDVTEDHSLIGYINKKKNNNLPVVNRLIELKPGEIGKKAKSIITAKKVPRFKIKTRKYPRELYEFLGLFVGDGSFDRKGPKNYYLHIAGGSDSGEIIKKIIVPLQKKGFIKTYQKKKKGDMSLSSLKLINITNECRHDGLKIFPRFIFDETEKNIASFLRGLFSSDGTVFIRGEKPIIRFTNTRKEFIVDAMKLLLFLGISSSFFRESKRNQYLGKISNTYSYHLNVKSQKEFIKKVNFIQYRKKKRLALVSKDSMQKRTIKNCDFDLTKVLKVKKINYSDYVYDIEVDETHRFFANNILAHNTDSVFVETKASDIEEAKKIGEKIASYIDNFYENFVKKNYKRKSFLDIEFDKCFVRFLMPRIRGAEIGAKKRYAGLLMKEGKEKIEFTGLEFVRRDWTALAKKFQMEVLDRIFHKKEVASFIKKFVDDLKQGKYDDLLVYRKAIRKSLGEYVKTTPPHVKAARKLGKLSSTIIKYVMTQNGPEPIQNITSRIDYEHYIDKQIKPLADSILVFFNQKFDDIIKGSKQTKLFGFG